jgi:hypothetical protein
MSELKRNQSLYSQPPTASREPCRSRPPAASTKLASESTELRLLEPGELTVVEGCDPYNGVGSRAFSRRAVAAPSAAPAHK